MTAYMTAADLRSAVPALANRTTITDDQLDGYVAEFAEIAERYRGASFTDRTTTDTTTLPDDWSMRWLSLANVGVTEVTAASIDGTALAVDDLTLDGAAGRLYNPEGWHGAVSVTYAYGSAPSAVLLRACREYVRSVALADASAVPRDVIAQTMEGTYTRFSTADWGAGRPTGYLEVDRLLNSLPDQRIPGIG